MVYAAVVTYPTPVSCSRPPSIAPAPLPLPTPSAIPALPLPFPHAPAPGPSPAVCLYLNASVSICGGTAPAITSQASLTACLANATGASQAAVSITQLADADSLPCQSSGRPAVGCYGQNATTDTSGEL